MWPVIRRVDDNGVVGDAEIVKRLEKFADVAIVLDHAVAVLGCSAGRLVAWSPAHA